MRLLVPLLIALFVFWRWRSVRAALLRQRRPPAESSSQAQTMVPCADCGLHIPLHEAIAGAQGHYCSAAHRAHRES